MKKVIAYVNTIRVHWLVEELEAAGIKEIMVTEYFSPSSQISRLELLSQDSVVERVREIVHRVGTTGSAGDHCFFLEEYDPDLPSQMPLGKTASRLEESRVKQLINFMLRGSHRKITTAFLLMTISILGVGVFIYLQTNAFQRSAKEAAETIQYISETTSAEESAMLEEMLAAERFHRGQAAQAARDFDRARRKLADTIVLLKGASIVSVFELDSLTALEHQFHFIVGGMFGIIDSLSRYGQMRQQKKALELSKSHNQIMSSLDLLRGQLLSHLSSLEVSMRELNLEKQRDITRSIEGVKASLLLLAAAAIGITIMIWLMVERNVSRPIQRLMEEAKTVDTVELR
jgi:nitrogen regulatory protein PII